MKIFTDKSWRRLTAAAGLGDPDAFAALFAATLPYQHRYAWAYLQDPYLVQDALLSTYQRARGRLHQLARPQTFPDWLTKINFEVCVEFLKKEISASLPDADDLQADAALNQRTRAGRERLRILSAKKAARFSPDRPKGGSDGTKTGEVTYPGITGRMADLLLVRLLSLIDSPPSTIPFDQILAAQKAQRKRTHLQRALTGSMILFLLILPLFFIAPSFQITEKEGKDGQPHYQIQRQGWFPPTRRVEASLNGRPLQVYRKADGLYTVLPEDKGRLAVTVTLWNFQTLTRSVQVLQLDNQPPRITSYRIRDDQIILNLQDTDSGIDYSSIYAVDPAGSKYRPYASYKNRGQVIFDIPASSSLRIHIADSRGNELDVTLETRSD